MFLFQNVEYLKILNSFLKSTTTVTSWKWIFELYISDPPHYADLQHEVWSLRIVFSIIPSQRIFIYIYGICYKYYWFLAEIPEPWRVTTKNEHVGHGHGEGDWRTQEKVPTKTTTHFGCYGYKTQKVPKFLKDDTTVMLWCSKSLFLFVY